VPWRLVQGTRAIGPRRDGRRRINAKSTIVLQLTLSSYKGLWMTPRSAPSILVLKPEELAEERFDVVPVLAEWRKELTQPGYRLATANLV